MRYGVMLFCGFMALSPQGLWAKHGHPQAEELLARARQVMEIRSAGDTPFQLSAQATIFLADGKQEKGTYELLWLSPEKWREQISFPSFRRLRILVGNRMWTQSPSEIPPYPVYEVEQALDFRYALMLRNGRKLSMVETGEKHGVLQSCLEMKPKLRTGAKLCFDPTTGVLRSNGETTYSDYAAWGSKLFPRTVNDYSNGARRMELKVSRLAAVSSPAPGPFVPPAGAKETPGCQDPVLPKTRKIVIAKYPRRAQHMRRQGDVLVLAMVGTNGRLQYARVVKSPGPSFTNAVFAALPQWKVKPASCGGTPIPYVDAIEISFKLYKSY